MSRKIVAISLVILMAVAAVAFAVPKAAASKELGGQYVIPVNGKMKNFGGGEMNYFGASDDWRVGSGDGSVTALKPNNVLTMSWIAEPGNDYRVANLGIWWTLKTPQPDAKATVNFKGVWTITVGPTDGDSGREVSCYGAATLDAAGQYKWLGTPMGEIRPVGSLSQGETKTGTFDETYTTGKTLTGETVQLTAGNLGEYVFVQFYVDLYANAPVQVTATLQLQNVGISFTPAA